MTSMNREGKGGTKYSSEEVGEWNIRLGRGINNDIKVAFLKYSLVYCTLISRCKNTVKIFLSTLL